MVLQNGNDRAKENTMKKILKEKLLKKQFTYSSEQNNKLVPSQGRRLRKLIKKTLYKDKIYEWITWWSFQHGYQYITITRKTIIRYKRSIPMIMSELI